MGNEYLAALVDEFYQLGAREVVVSPGSRSTSLALLFEEYGKFRTFVDIDERSNGFFALGIAKAHQRPIILVVTSGTAGAHLYPAVIEAKHSRVPLIILTADRPYDLQFVGAPQTTNQSQMFGNSVNHYENLAVPTEKLFWSYPRKVAQRMFTASIAYSAGPVQLNVPISEPLVPDLSAENFEKGRQKFTVNLGEISTSSNLTAGQNVLILAGPDYSADYHHEVLRFAEDLNAPILADPLSNFRSYENPNILDSYDAFLTNENLAKPDVILQFGQMMISKRVQQWLARQNCDYWQVDPSLEYRNPAQTTTNLIQSSVKSFVKSNKIVTSDSNFLSNWQEINAKYREKLNTASEEDFEGTIVRKIQNIIPDDSQIMSSNSMTIRDLDYFWQAKNQEVKIFGNRGVNGIDGIESTALGLSTNGKPTILLTGDLSFLHDLNGLILGKTEHLNLTIVLFNNDGGGIFHMLPQRKEKHFDRLFSTAHGLEFSALSNLTGLNYHEITDLTDFEEKFTSSLRSSGIHLLEVKTEKDKSVTLRKKYTTL